MKIHEYQAKEIFSKYGIPVERHTLCRTAAGAVAAYKRMGSDRVVIKAQVLTGGRGKAGGVKQGGLLRVDHQYNSGAGDCGGVYSGAFRAYSETCC